jgi:hypothetical protein
VWECTLREKSAYGHGLASWTADNPLHAGCISDGKGQLIGPTIACPPPNRKLRQWLLSIHLWWQYKPE